jgi:hypothetical protein
MNLRFVFILALCTSALGGSAMGQNDVNAIIQRSVVANKRDWDAAPKFDCSERDRAHDGTKTYEDTMISGSPYQRLIAVHGKPLTPAQAAEEKHKLENAISERKNESPQKRAERIAKYEDERKRDHSMMEEMVKAFDFKLLGESKLGGHAVYFLQASPRPGYHPPNMETEALTGMQGTLWIDKKTFQWVKVIAEVTHPVSIKGFLAQVEPGTYFELEKIPVAPGIWLAKHFSMRSRAKVLKLIPKNGEEDDTYFNCHKASETSDQ